MKQSIFFLCGKGPPEWCTTKTATLLADNSRKIQTMDSPECRSPSDWKFSGMPWVPGKRKPYETWVAPACSVSCSNWSMLSRTSVRLWVGIAMLGSAGSFSCSSRRWPQRDPWNRCLCDHCPWLFEHKLCWITTHVWYFISISHVEVVLYLLTSSISSIYSYMSMYHLTWHNISHTGDR